MLGGVCMRSMGPGGGRRGVAVGQRAGSVGDGSGSSCLKRASPTQKPTNTPVVLASRRARLPRQPPPHASETARVAGAFRAPRLRPAAPVPPPRLTARTAPSPPAALSTRRRLARPASPPAPPHPPHHVAQRPPKYAAPRAAPRAAPLTSQNSARRCSPRRCSSTCWASRCSSTARACRWATCCSRPGWC